MKQVLDIKNCPGTLAAGYHTYSPDVLLLHDLTERSFLNEKLKRMYIRGYEERLKRLQRSD